MHAGSDGLHGGSFIIHRAILPRMKASALLFAPSHVFDDGKEEKVPGFRLDPCLKVTEE